MAPRSFCVDSSVAVPALLVQHDLHVPCRDIVARSPSIPAHALAETYSVLTRLPTALRLNPMIASDLVRGAFRDRVLTLDSKTQRTTASELAAAGVLGGAVFDGLVALAARAHGYRLFSRDHRAVATYERLGVDFELVSDN